MRAVSFGALTGPPFCGILCSRLHGLTCILTIGMVNISLFKNFVPLGALLPTDRAELAKYSRVGVYQPGQIIFSRGESAQTVPFLISGEVEVFDGGHGHVIRGDTPEARNALANGPRRVTTATCLKTAQVLLVHDDVLARDRYLNARGTLKTLLKLGVVPIINENDTVVTDEIRFGDNDTLAALVANLIDAEVL